MECHSCGGFEHFTQQEQEQEQERGTSTACAGKSTTNKCLYTAQGVFMCIRDDKPDINVKNMGIVDNESMLLEPQRDNSRFRHAAPW